ncbi:OLC1v1019434C1 [Oldenlandia corymbosa var. corymbosa]|uniref:PHD finger protein ING n=1 Tax=Oldenlandia corymbosa var. corymbosa TaxID=529605 RepID=A0AAV1EDY4_OLDCO|nr:OLC1v1019434C1 [Oldenlandia corymbosa var. corymbosa]
MSSSIEEFQDNLSALPTILQKKYALLRDLDKSLQGIQRQNEQRCQQEIGELTKRIKDGGIAPNSPLLKFSDEALDEQKHAVRIADEKVALAVHVYDMVDAHIQQLDQYLKKLDEEIRNEKDNAASTGPPSATPDNSVKPGKSGESGRGRKKTRLATATAAAAAASSASTAAAPTGMDLDLPVDPNEPTYCVCNQVSYGEMVACDHPGCKIEWFHLGCVGLREPPKGNWYCSDCVGTQKRRKSKT